MTHKGYRFRAVWNRIYWRPPQETFHEFIIFVLHETLHHEWLKAQWTNAPDDQHQIARWFMSFRDWTRRESTDTNKVPGGWSAVPTGDAQALVALAYDVYTLRHTNALPKALVDRLRDHHEFQGTRYEIAVAATFARMGWNIQYLTDKAKKHSEFVARDPSGKHTVAVEAKSRRRPGVLHHAGSLDPLAAARGDVEHLLRDALRQNPGNMPFIVFIDLNAIPTPGQPYPDKPWWTDLRDMIERLGTPTAENPDPVTAVMVTNFAYHYAGSAEQAPAGEFVVVASQYPRHALPVEVIAHISDAVAEYGKVPLDES